MEEELTLEQSIRILLEEVPPPVRAFVLNELQPTTQRLMDKYHLHVDHAGVLETELLLMLLGQEQPADFMKTLQDIGIAPQTVMEIAADVNAQVFVRLREQEREAAVRPVQAMPAKPAPLPPPSLVPPTPTVVVPEPPRPVPPPPANLPGQEPFNPVPVAAPQPPAPVPAPVAPIYVPPAPPVPPPAPVAQPAPVPQPVPAQPQEPPHVTRTMAEDMRALKSGVDPLAVAHHEGPAWTAPAAAPAPQPVAQPAYVAPVAPPPAPAPRVEVPRPAPPPIAPVRPTPITVPGSANGEVRREYGLDPYREPIE